jgi:hypothetical protein
MIYILRIDSDEYSNLQDIATFDDEESAESFKVAYAVIHPLTSTVISAEEIYHGVQDFAPLYHYSVMIPTVDETSCIGDNEVIKNESTLRIERIISKSEPCPRGGGSFSTHITGTRITPEGPIHTLEDILVIDAYGYSESEVTGWVDRIVAELRISEKTDLVDQ